VTRREKIEKKGVFMSDKKRDFEEIVNTFTESLLNLGKIICPHCEAELGDEEKLELTTYHGNEHNVPSRVECPECEGVFLVTEHVSRIWEVEIECADQ
jgi:uncharacterized protein with PIN domain